MAINTKDFTQSDGNTMSKRDKILGLVEKHKPLFEKEGVLNPKFIPRLCYKHNGELTIGFYPKEIYGGMDIYTEFCSKDFTPEDPKRTLWKWIYNPEYAKEYHLSDAHPGTGDRRYLIPIAELINVTEFYAEQEPASEEIVEESTEYEIEEKEFLIESPSAGDDVPYAAMTLRDYAAIQWKRPVSLKPWLNDLIREKFK
jgi:hypothetical protein